MSCLLMVEDDPHDAELIGRALTAVDGVAVEHASSGPVALDRLASGGVDVVLLDLHLPEMDGVAILGAIRANAACRHLPVVMLTSSANEADLRRAYAAGANAYVVKPPRLKELRAAVEDLARFWTRHNRTVASTR